MAAEYRSILWRVLDFTRNNTGSRGKQLRLFSLSHTTVIIVSKFPFSDCTWFACTGVSKEMRCKIKHFTTGAEAGKPGSAGEVEASFNTMRLTTHFSVNNLRFEEEEEELSREGWCKIFKKHQQRQCKGADFGGRIMEVGFQ